MFSHKFGIECELTGVTRAQAARVLADEVSGTVGYTYDHYDTYLINAMDGRVWKIMNDSSIQPKKKVNGRLEDAGYEYRVEMVSPILTYREDIDTLQRIIRALRAAGGVTNDSCGIHLHLAPDGYNARSIRNFINIIASKGDLLYNALEVKPERMRYCQKLDDALVARMNKVKPKTLKQIEDIWYEGYTESRGNRYHTSRYSLLNLHSFFTGNHTIELRVANSTLDEVKVTSIIVLALALNHQALTLKYATARKIQSDNPRFAMRTYLNRIGMIGDEFASCREHLTKALSGSAAWRFRAA
ncbi:hypothetical protein AGMMS49992_23750 [Clostridia bacterium]|nr:hypothetical protein AGMMS49992_23750 [Clostridia bacterium]